MSRRRRNLGLWCRRPNVTAQSHPVEAAEDGLCGPQNSKEQQLIPAPYRLGRAIPELLHRGSRSRISATLSIMTAPALPAMCAGFVDLAMRSPCIRNLVD